MLRNMLQLWDYLRNRPTLQENPPRIEIIQIKWRRLSSLLCVFRPRKLCYNGSFIHWLYPEAVLVFTQHPCLSLSLPLCVCVLDSFQREANTGGYGAPNPKQCVTTSQQDVQTELSHLWTLGKSVHWGNVCTVLVLEQSSGYAGYLHGTEKQKKPPLKNVLCCYVRYCVYSKGCCNYLTLLYLYD